MPTLQLQENNTIITSKLQEVLGKSFPEVDGNDRSVKFENPIYSIDASFNISTLEFSCEFYFDGEFVELTDEDEELVAKFLYNADSTSSSFSSSDYSHFESLIHKSN